MKLPDFTEFAPFNEMRKKVGTSELGYFELFDPNIHLTGSERSELQNHGVLRPVQLLKVLPDRTLAQKNSRVIAYIPNENWYRVRREYPTYHVAFCEQLDALRLQQDAVELLVTTRVAEDYDLIKIRAGGEVAVQAHGFVVCKHCLQRLRYKNYDEFRNRRRAYSQKVLSEFSLKEFFSLYPQYPLSFGARPVAQSSPVPAELLE